MSNPRKSISYITNSLKHAHSHHPPKHQPLASTHPSSSSARRQPALLPPSSSSQPASPQPAPVSPAIPSSSTTVAPTPAAAPSTDPQPNISPPSQPSPSTSNPTPPQPFATLPLSSTASASYSALDAQTLALVQPATAYVSSSSILASANVPFPFGLTIPLPSPLSTPCWSSTGIGVDTFVVSHGIGSGQAAIVVPIGAQFSASSSPELSTIPRASAMATTRAAAPFGARLAAGLASGSKIGRIRAFSTSAPSAFVTGAGLLFETSFGLRGAVSIATSGSTFSHSTTVPSPDHRTTPRSQSEDLPAAGSASVTATPFFTSALFSLPTLAPAVAENASSSSSATTVNSPPPPSPPVIGTLSLHPIDPSSTHSPQPTLQRHQTNESAASQQAQSDAPITGLPFAGVGGGSFGDASATTEAGHRVEPPPTIDAHRGFIFQHGAFGIPKRGHKGVAGGSPGGLLENRDGAKMTVAAAGGQLGVGINGGIHSVGMGVSRMGVNTNLGGSGTRSGPSHRGRDEPLSVQVGEDAYFLRPDSLGVADGVGGFSGRKGANSALFSRQLMHHCSTELARYDDVDDEKFLMYNEVNPVDILQVAFERCVQEAKAQGIVGASTALLAVLRRNELRVANMGDCCCSVIRGNDYIFRSEEQQHSFNYPFQIGTNSNDVPHRDAQRFTIKVQKDDIVILSSDGLVDNLFDDDILDEVLHFAHASQTAVPQSSPASSSAPLVPSAKPTPSLIFRRFSPQAVSEALCSRAKAVSEDQRAVTSPFQQRAMEEGIHYVGGKADDITVAIGVIGDLEDSPNRR